MDNRNSSAVKRARTDGSRRDDDWTCPSCGNVNFSIRTTCNMRNCTQPRPADRNSKTIVKTVHAPHGFLATSPYLVSGTSSSMFMGLPPYASSAFPGSSLPPYDVPFSGGSAFPYNYGNRFSGGNPYRAPLHLSGPPYSSGPMMANGGLYGIPAMIERYGLNFPVSPGGLGLRPGFFPDVSIQRSAAEAFHDDDWTCPNCGNVNFSFRTICNMRMCNSPKPVVSRGTRMDKNSKPKIPEGSWKCDKCGNINCPFRTKCNRQSCGVEKLADTEEPAAQADNEPEQGVLGPVLWVVGEYYDPELSSSIARVVVGESVVSSSCSNVRLVSQPCGLVHIVMSKVAFLVLVGTKRLCMDFVSLMDCV